MDSSTHHADMSGTDSSNSSESEELSNQTTAAVAIAVKKSKAKTAVKPSKIKRERKAIQLRSMVWDHFSKFDEPLFAEVDGVNKQVGITKKAACNYCKQTLACDSRGNGTSSLKKHIEVHCKVYPASLGCENNEDGKQAHLSSELIEGFNKHAIDYVKRRMLSWDKTPLCGGKFLHVRCFPHVINLIVKSGLREMESSVATIRNAIRFVRSSAARTEAFKNCVEKDKIECKKICILDVPTRWNSTYMMLETAIELKKAFQRMEDDDPLHYRSYFTEEEGLDEDEDDTEAQRVRGRKIVGPPKDVDWEKAECFVKFLRVFYQVTINLSASLEPTAHSAFHDIVGIKAELDELTAYPPDDSSNEVDHILYDMSRKMTIKFNKYFKGLDDINPLFLVALVLDPRYKLKYLERQAERMLNLSSTEVKKISDNLKDLMVKLCDKYGSGSNGCGSSQRSKNSDTVAGVESSSKGRRNANDKMVSGKRKAMLEDWDKQLEEGEDLVVGHEVDRYLLDPIEKPKVRGKFKITEWWKANGSKYLCLQAVARDVLAIQVSTVASESSFSTGKRVIDPYRSSMTPKTVEALICFQNWLMSDSIMTLEYIPTIEEMEFYEEVENERLEEVRQEEAMKSATNNNNIVDNHPSADASKISAYPPCKKTKLTKTARASLKKK